MTADSRSAIEDEPLRICHPDAAGFDSRSARALLELVVGRHQHQHMSCDKWNGNLSEVRRGSLSTLTRVLTLACLAQDAVPMREERD
jgi:hypothetical protein